MTSRACRRRLANSCAPASIRRNFFETMKLSRSDADIYLPAISAGLTADAALARTTHLCVIAHQDDIEINAYPPVAECFERKDRFFTGVVMTNGAGSARTGKFANVTD